MAAVARRFYISGLVQGVGYRFFADAIATRLGISGYVKNLFDGRVEVYAIGSAEALHALRQELRRGPRMANVEDLIEEDAQVEPEYSHRFSIEPGE